MNDKYRKQVTLLNSVFTNDDKAFLVSFEQGEPEWNKCSLGNVSNYPSVKWKLQNILKLKETNPEKHKYGIEKLSSYF